MNKTVERTQLNSTLLSQIAVLPKCVSAVLATVMRGGRGDTTARFHSTNLLVLHCLYNKQECQSESYPRFPVEMQQKMGTKTKRSVLSKASLIVREWPGKTSALQQPNTSTYWSLPPKRRFAQSNALRFLVPLFLMSTRSPWCNAPRRSCSTINIGCISLVPSCITYGASTQRFCEL